MKGRIYCCYCKTKLLKMKLTFESNFLMLLLAPQSRTHLSLKCKITKNFKKQTLKNVKSGSCSYQYRYNFKLDFFFRKPLLSYYIRTTTGSKALRKFFFNYFFSKRKRKRKRALQQKKKKNFKRKR